MTPKDRMVAEFTTCFALSFVGAFFIFMNVPAMAQTLNSVDVSPIANNVIGWSAAVLAVAAGVVSKFIISFLSAKTGVHNAQLEAFAQEKLNNVLIRAIDYAELEAKALVADKTSGVHSIRIDDWFIRTAVGYVQRSIPDLIQVEKLSPQRIGEMIRARLNAFLKPVVVNSDELVPLSVEIVRQPAPQTLSPLSPAAELKNPSTDPFQVS